MLHRAGVRAATACARNAPLMRATAASAPADTATAWQPPRISEQYTHAPCAHTAGTLRVGAWGTSMGMGGAWRGMASFTSMFEDVVIPDVPLTDVRMFIHIMGGGGWGVSRGSTYY